MQPRKVLPEAFFKRDARTVAKELIGKLLCHGDVCLRITETEAYLGDGSDPASHAHRGPTPRNAAMFEPGGIAYVYFTYGMHHCFNVVTGPKGRGEAVLIRAGVIVGGHETVRARRPRAKAARDLTNGPAKLVQALGLGPQHNGVCLRTSELQIFDDGVRAPAQEVRTTPRIGITKAAELLYRWVWNVSETK